MQLFYVCANDSIDCGAGDDHGWLISAPDGATAAKMWCEDTGRDDPLVFRIPSVNPKPMIHKWHDAWEKRGAQNIKV